MDNILKIAEILISGAALFVSSLSIAVMVYLYWHSRISAARIELSSYLNKILFELRNLDGNEASFLLKLRNEYWIETHRLFLHLRYWMFLDRKAADYAWRQFQGLDNTDTRNWSDYQKGMQNAFKSPQDAWDRIQPLLELADSKSLD